MKNFFPRFSSMMVMLLTLQSTSYSQCNVDFSYAEDAGNTIHFYDESTFDSISDLSAALTVSAKT
ncbi:MAG TPA: hypothetical protein VE978_06860 [Chitinophagales bacterium]|nr:hypothetical protein [Chitinophagales bacterium]